MLIPYQALVWPQLRGGLIEKYKTMEGLDRLDSGRRFSFVGFED